MANVTTKLALDFNAEGKEKGLRMTYNYAQSNIAVNTVKAIGNAIVENNHIFLYPPTELTAAKIITTTETDYDISN